MIAFLASKVLPILILTPRKVQLWSNNITHAVSCVWRLHKCIWAEKLVDYCVSKVAAMFAFVSSGALSLTPIKAAKTHILTTIRKWTLETISQQLHPKIHLLSLEVWSLQNAQFNTETVAPDRRVLSMTKTGKSETRWRFVFEKRQAVWLFNRHGPNVFLLEKFLSSNTSARKRNLTENGEDIGFWMRKTTFSMFFVHFFPILVVGDRFLVHFYVR